MDWTIAIRLAPTDAHDARTKDGKGELVSQPALNSGVLLEMLLCSHLCQTFVKHSRFTSHASCGRKNKRSEDTTLHYLIRRACVLLSVIETLAREIGA